MQNVVRVLLGHTRADIAAMPGSDVASWIVDFVRENLTEYEAEYNKDTLRWVYTITGKFVVYNRNTGIISIPINYFTRLKNYLEERRCEVVTRNFADYTLRKIDLKPDPQWHDLPHQIKLIEKCSERVPGMKGLAMQTGKGKTYAAIKSIINLGYAACIIVPGLTDQWISEIKKYTNATDDDVYKIQEVDSLIKLFKSGVKPSIFVCSISTMRLYAKGGGGYAMLPYTFQQFFEYFGIGVKVIDECHLNFHAIVKLDMKCNVPYNLYCTATFTQNNRYARRIFDVVFPPEIRYGANAYDRYVDCHFYYYSGEVLENKCCRARGYNHILYEKQIMKTQRAFRNHADFIQQLIYCHYINNYQKGNKLLIFVSSIDFACKLVARLCEKLPEYRTAAYIGSSSREVLTDNDIIVATTGKAGTGLDLKGLTTVINTVSLQSVALSQQLFGRLRKINDRDTIYVDICDMGIPAQCRHAESRKTSLKRMASKYHEYRGLADPTGGIHIEKPIVDAQLSS